MLEIPLNSNPEQLFSIVLSGTTYDCRVTFNFRLSVWTISFSSDGVEIISGVSLLGGVDILKPYNMGIENMYAVNLDDPLLDATEFNLGDAVKLVIVTEDELKNGSTV